MKNSKNGYSIISILMFIIILGGIGIYGVQIGIGYLDQQTIKASVQTVLADAKSSESNTPREIKTKILRKLSVSTVNLDDSDVSVTKSDKGFDVDVDFTKTIKITEKIKLLMDLAIHETTPH